MAGWIIPPPKEPTKSEKDFTKERADKVRWLARRGYLKSERIKQGVFSGYRKRVYANSKAKSAGIRAQKLVVIVRKKRTYVKRDVLEDAARKEKEALDAKRQANCKIEQQEDRPREQEPHRVRQHHCGDSADAGVLHVALTINHD